MGYVKVFFDRYTGTIVWVAAFWWILQLVTTPFRSSVSLTNPATLIGSLFGSILFAILIVGIYAIARAVLGQYK